MKLIKILKTTCFIQVILLLITPFLYRPTLLFGAYNERFFYFANVSILTMFLAGVGLLMYHRRLEITLKIIDVFVVFFLLYSFSRLFFTNFTSIMNFQFLIQIFMTFFYFIVIRISKPSTSFSEDRLLQLLVSSFLLVGLFQALIGLAQFYGFHRPNSIFKVIGTFNNPNHYTAYLISILPLAFGIHQMADVSDRAQRLLIYLSGIASITITFILSVTNTRAAWLAGSVGMIFVLVIKYNLFNKIRDKLKKAWQIALISATVLVIGVIISITLFQLKPDSAMGRLFIWKTTMDMIQEYPIYGIGYDRFSIEYDHYQAAYFQAGLGSADEIRVAQNTKHAHNDFLQILAETGLIGIIVFGGVLFSALLSTIQNLFSSSKKNKRFVLQICMQASFLALLVNMLFFFPLKMLEIQIHFYLFLALISTTSDRQTISKIKLSILAQKGVGLLILSMAVTLGVYIFHLNQAYINWQIAKKSATVGELNNALQSCEKAALVLHNNGEFLFFYGGLLYKAKHFKNAQSVLSEARERFTDPNLEILLAWVHQQLGGHKSVEMHLSIAMNMVPHKFYAKYLLAEHYRDEGDIIKAKNLARQILAMPVKIPSSAVTEIKAKTEQMLISLEEKNDK